MRPSALETTFWVTTSTSPGAVPGRARRRPSFAPAATIRPPRSSPGPDLRQRGQGDREQPSAGIRPRYRPSGGCDQGRLAQVHQVAQQTGRQQLQVLGGVEVEAEAAVGDDLERSLGSRRRPHVRLEAADTKGGRDDLGRAQQQGVGAVAGVGRRDGDQRLARSRGQRRIGGVHQSVERRSLQQVGRSAGRMSTDRAPSRCSQRAEAQRPGPR